MRKYLIVNADDFGLNKGVNRGVIDSFIKGCVTSTSLLTTEEGFEDAVRKIKENPSLDIGIHLNIVSGKAKSNLLLLFLKRLTQKKALRKEIYNKFEGQIKRALASNIKISHLDTEKHLHIFPFILEILIELSKKYKIKSIRFPFEKKTNLIKVSPRQLLKIFFSYMFYKRCLKLFEEHQINHPDFFYGVSLSTRFTVENLKKIIDDLEEGTSEVSCHPAYRMSGTSSFIDGQSRDEERETLTNPSILCYIKEKGIALTSFKTSQYQK